MVSAVVPDMRAIFAAYDRGEITNELNERFVYSYEQPSHHVWCYDVDSLRRVFEEAGFVDVEAIDPLTWEPVWWKDGPGVPVAVRRARHGAGAGQGAASPHASHDDDGSGDATRATRCRPTRCCSSASGSCAPSSTSWGDGAGSGDPAAVDVRPAARARSHPRPSAVMPEGSSQRKAATVRDRRLRARDA